jgi:PMC2NT (NUC016) domain
MDAKAYPEWQASLLKQLVSTTRSASAVGSHDIPFERSIDPDFDSSLTAVTHRLLSLTNQLLKFAGSQAEELENEDDLEDRWADIVDMVDTLLERAVGSHTSFTDFRILALMSTLERRRRERRL